MAFPFMKNEFIERVYWVDGYNEKKFQLNDFSKIKTFTVIRTIYVHIMENSCYIDGNT